MRTDIHFWPKVISLAECLCQEITASDLPGVCFCGIIPGEFTVLDYCSACDVGCGQAWVRVVGVGLVVSTGTTARATIASPCTAPLQAQIEVGIVRCAPMPDDDGTPPDMASQLAASELQMADMAASLRAIRCCDAIGAKDFEITGWSPMGPAGGCVGGAWQVVLFEAP